MTTDIVELQRDGHSFGMDKKKLSISNIALVFGVSSTIITNVVPGGEI